MAQNVTPVVLKVQGFEDREVLKVNYKFDQETDVEGQTNGIPRGGRVNIRVKAMNDGNNQLLQWMLGAHDPRQMTIVFNNTKDGSLMKKIEGVDCYCVHYVERWEDQQMHYEDIDVVCRELKNGPVSYENPWK